MKTQEKLAIEGPSAALRAVKLAIKALVVSPRYSQEVDGTTQVPVALQITRENEHAVKEYVFEVTRDEAGLANSRTAVPEPEAILLRA